jgi:lipopolysaccharide transport system ATP-binding protein
VPVPDTVISVEKLSKRYLVGHRSTKRERYTALRDVIAREARNFTRKAIDAFRGRQIVQGDEVEEFWALKDVSFEVKRGEVVGIIGRNGAGKSTLLKILSRITEPTEGRVRLRGRVASLLEVGTGFHPELTGRENIFLNGAILGMTRREIRSKFDEIVGFAEVEKFLDTPVKHYSSGMYVRLAFAVAAHLEPDILVVDEVLAVGDAEFQKKCLGKMGEVARGGRTVLFVSHNTSAVQSLCEKTMFIQNGRVAVFGPSSNVITRYLAATGGGPVSEGDLTRLRRSGEGNIRFRRIKTFDRDGRLLPRPRAGEEVIILIEFDGTRVDRGSARLVIIFYDAMETPLFVCGNETSFNEPLQIGAGDKVTCRIQRFPLDAGRYKIGLFLERNGVVEDWLQEFIPIDVAEGSFFRASCNLPTGWSHKTVLVDHECHRLDDATTFMRKNAVIKELG